MKDVLLNQLAESDWITAAERVMPFEEWLALQRFIDSNDLVVWLNVPVGQELFRYEGYPHVEVESQEEDGITLKTVTWYLLPPGKDGYLRFVETTWTAMEGFEGPTFYTAPADSRFAKNFFKRFVDLMAERPGDHVGFGFFMIFSGTCKFYVYSHVKHHIA